MDDFNSFAKENGKKGGESAGGMSLANLITKLATKYNGASEAEILSAIFEEAKKGRQNGTLSDADLDRFATMLSPLLDEKKRSKLKYVINKLKEMK